MYDEEYTLKVRGDTLILTCRYEDRSVPLGLGAEWKRKRSEWHMPLTVRAATGIYSSLDYVRVTESAEKAIEEQIAHEDKLLSIKRLAKKDVPTRLRVPGIKMPLYNYQKWGVAFANSNGRGVLIADEMGLGKALVEGTEVYTPVGSVPIEKLKVGEEVIGSDGQSTRVVGFYPQGFKNAYHVTFSDGASVECCDEHLWHVSTPSRLNRGNPPKVMTLRQIMNSGIERRNGKNGTRWNWYIPLVQPVNFCNEPSEILAHLPPYVLGALLGDGHFSKSNHIGFTTADKEVVERIGRITLSSWSLKSHKAKYQYGLANDGLDTSRQFVSDYLKTTGLASSRSHNKFIPDDYKYTSVGNRLAMLQGLMDTDGTVQKGKRGNTAIFCTTSKHLCEDVVWLTRSLGGTASAGDKKPFYYNDKRERVYCNKAYLVTLSLPGGMCPFLISRKANFYPNNRKKYSPSRAIVKIEATGKKNMYCISVDAEDSLYVIRDFIVTHNSLQGIATALVMKEQRGISNCLVVTPASLKWNWPLEIQKFSDEPYVVIDGAPSKRFEQWNGKVGCRVISGGKAQYYAFHNNTRPFFFIVNFELVQEDLFGGKEYTIRDGDSDKAITRKTQMAEKAFSRAVQLADVRQRVWDLIIVDEAHALKTHRSKRTRNLKELKSDFRLALTGTPMDGRLEELHSVMDWVMPNLLGSKTRFLQRHAEFDYWGRVKRYHDIGVVQEAIAPFYIRRLKKDVLKELPDKVYQNRFVILSPAERKIYNKMKKQEHPITEYEEAIVRVIRCKQFCDSPELVGLDMKHNSKMELFLDIIDEIVVQNGHKAIVFSQYSTMCELIRAKFEEMGLNYLYIWSDTEKQERATMQEKFNNDSHIDIMLGTDAMSLGLNFVASSYVINYDDAWSPSVMQQRSDRSHRIGQKNSVTVINFVCKDTIEEHIRSVLASKAVISANTLGDNVDELTLKRLSPQEMLELL